MEAFRREGQSPNTQRTYETALRYWGAWHALRFGQPIQGPVSPAAVIQFIVDHLEHQPTIEAPQVGPFTPSSRTTQHLLPASIDRLLVDRGYKAKPGPWTLATVETRLAALSQAHDAYIAKHDHLGLGAEINPLRDPRVRQLLSAARRAYARRGRAPSRPQAATANILETLVASPAAADGARRLLRPASRMYAGTVMGLSTSSIIRRPTAVAATGRRTSNPSRALPHKPWPAGSAS
jgi:hypothetical protein